jgi:hypothetical protein
VYTRSGHGRALHDVGGLASSMRKPGTDENNVKMSDVLCDFCHREWTDDSPMIEGHQGSCICGECVARAYTAVIVEGASDAAPPDYFCVMCLEGGRDRASLGRAGEPGYKSPMHEACICRRCTKLAAGVLHKSTDYEWTKPR